MESGIRYIDATSGRRTGLTALAAAVQLQPMLTATAAPLAAEVDLQAGPPVGVAAARSGDVYVPDAVGHRILRWDGCDGAVAPLACVEALGDDEPALVTPVAAAISAAERLLVADAGRNAVVIVDPPTGLVTDVWDLAPASPSSIAIDSRERAYVAFRSDSPGGARVRRFDSAGREDDAFSLGGAPLRNPVAVVVAAIGKSTEETLVVLDAPEIGPSHVRTYRLDGRVRTMPARPATVAQTATVIALYDDRFIVGTTESVVAYDASGRQIGLVTGLEAPVRSLFVDCHGHLLALAGRPTSLSRIVDGNRWATSGSFTVELEVEKEVDWHHLDLLDVALPPRTHIRLFTCSTAAGNAAPPMGDEFDQAPQRKATSIGRWRSHPVDADSVRLICAPGARLTVTARLEGDGTATPTIGLLRVAFDQPSWLRFLPAVYELEEPGMRRPFAEADEDAVAAQRADAAFLERALALLERSLGEESEKIDDLPLLIDALAAPDRPAGWLDWLAGWLALELDAEWPAAQRRAALMAEFELAGIRGTRRGLSLMVERETGVVPLVDEPATRALSWSLGQTSMLGFTTMVAPAEAAGAVLDTTAIVDGSHLIGDDEYGSPLYEDLVGRICIRLPMTADRASVEPRVRSVLDRELPAHTSYHLCLTEAAMRVGAQAQVGIDSIVAGESPALVVDGKLRLGVDTVLPAKGSGTFSHGTGARVGHDAVVQ